MKTFFKISSVKSTLLVKNLQGSGIFNMIQSEKFQCPLCTTSYLIFSLRACKYENLGATSTQFFFQGGGEWVCLLPCSLPWEISRSAYPDAISLVCWIFSVIMSCLECTTVFLLFVMEAVCSFFFVFIGCGSTIRWLGEGTVPNVFYKQIFVLWIHECFFVEHFDLFQRLILQPCINHCFSSKQKYIT